MELGQPPTQPAPDGTTPPVPPAGGTEGDEDTVESGAQSVAEVEAFWRNRVSQKDRGHKAAEKALREENESLRKALEARSGATPSGGQSGSGDDATAELRRQVEEERKLRIAAERRAKFPALAERIDAPDLFAALDEASLAKLNAELDTGGGNSRIAPTAPRRPAGAPVRPKSFDQMSKEELEAALKRSIEAGALQNEG